MKMYVNMKNLNEYEKANDKISYKTLVGRFFDDMILCNNIVKDLEDLEVVAGSDHDEENDTCAEVYQYFIVNGYFNEDDLQKVGDELGTVYYHRKLGIYILGARHFGSSWAYTLTDIEPTQNYDEANI